MRNIAQLTDLPNRPKEERLSMIERTHPGASVDIASMIMRKIETYFKGQVTSEEIVTAADLILWKYTDLTVADIQYFVREIASSEFYGHLNANKIVVSFSEFYERRENAYADHREKEHANRKSEEGSGYATFDYDKMIAKAESDKLKKAEKKTDKPVVAQNQYNAKDFEKEDLGF